MSEYEAWRRATSLSGAFTYDDMTRGIEKMQQSDWAKPMTMHEIGKAMAAAAPFTIRKYTDQAAFCVRPPARVPVPDMRPTRGYIQHLSRIPDGERWPVLSFRVVGEHPEYRGHDAMLTNEGRWRWFEGYAHLCPDECHLSQGQLGDVLAAAGIAPGLPFQSQDTMNLTTIEYVERVAPRPAVAMTEEWKPRAPTWRGGKPWR